MASRQGGVENMVTPMCQECGSEADHVHPAPDGDDPTPYCYQCCSRSCVEPEREFFTCDEGVSKCE